MSDFRKYLSENIVLTDGAMGTYYDLVHSDGVELVEQENLLHPKRIIDIHREYIRSGARILRTNTFASNSNFFPNRNELKENITAGIQIAYEAVSLENEEVYVAADIGTLYDIGKDYTEVVEDYKYVIDCFIEAGAEIIWFETQNDLFYIEELAGYIKEVKPDAYVIVSFCVDKTGYSKSGISYSRIINKMCELDSVDAYGFNCSMAGSQLVSLLEKISFPSDKPLVALPNAGYPYEVRGQIFYGHNLNYYVENEKSLQQLGVNILGGCCGTSPEYVAATEKAIDNKIYQKKISQTQDSVVTRTESDFWKKLQSGRKPVLVELDPPADMNYKKVIDGAMVLKNHNVDLLTLSDSPLARTRMDASLLGAKVQKEVGIDVMPHISCRDRNIISLRGTIMGAYANDLKHFLFVTGDPISKQNRADLTQVFNCNSIRLMNLVDGMNNEEFVDDTVVFGGALNYNGVNVDAIARRMKLKMEQGCTFFLTQPIYSDDDIERIRLLREMTGAKIMAGIMPLVSRKNAMFIAKQMPGMNVPDYIVDKYNENMSREESEQVAIDISLDIAEKLKDCCDGYYFMTPFNRVNLICNIIDELNNIEVKK